MIDAILLINDYTGLIAHLDQHSPDSLIRDEQGHLPQAPEIIGFERTPAVIQGNRLMTYLRMTLSEAAPWRETPFVDVLAEAPFEGPGTAATVYQQIWDDPDTLAKYNSVYDRTPVVIDGDDGDTYTPPAMFGMIAGA